MEVFCPDDGVRVEACVETGVGVERPNLNAFKLGLSGVTASSEGDRIVTFEKAVE